MSYERLGWSSRLLGENINHKNSSEFTKSSTCVALQRFSLESLLGSHYTLCRRLSFVRVTKIIEN
jgi:hypothetical protein